MSDLICGRHQYNGAFIGKPCPMCTVEEEQHRTPAELLAEVLAVVKWFDSGHHNHQRAQAALDRIRLVCAGKKAKP